MERSCIECGNAFEISGGNRTRCYSCSPPRVEAAKKLAQKKTKQLTLVGVPFTIEHFRSFAESLILPDGTYFILEDFQALFLEDVWSFTGTAECILCAPQG